MTVDRGSCEYGYIDEQRFPGTHVAALDFPGHAVPFCGACFEVKCDPSSFRDNYGEALERSNVCHDTGASLVVRITDTVRGLGWRVWMSGAHP